MWKHVGQSRPPFALDPGEGQESVWDYPRPPAIVADAREIVVCAGEVEVARTRRAKRILETASPPTFYLPLGDVEEDLLLPSNGRSFCEWKGAAVYWAIVSPGGYRIEQAAWSYPSPSAAFASIKDHLSFYPGRVDCFVDGVRVRPQPGLFYGGWITPDVVGPFKGEPGTEGW
jgi:uncharacterized protein (DUF427 family)